MPEMELTSSQIRRQFIDFFVERAEHAAVPSSPVVPHDDPTLLFTNAGMNQFKDVFLGAGSRPYTRAVDSQKCIRAGGKHNDLDDVGKDTYHHTFFEMLGNWSFGDYFKPEAIRWAWELLTKVWGLDPKRLHATYFEGDDALGLEPDTEARDLWLQYLPPEQVHPGDAKDNFWEMGDTGPCGPCSELHYDSTDDLSGAAKVNRDDPHVIEIWNLVFIQFNRRQDGSLEALPAKHVDTGMGFERIVAVLQGKKSNYDTDVFTPLFDCVREITGARQYEGSLTDPIDIAYRVIADHVRCLTFALTDGAVPSNERRGYVLRRILRRGVRYGRQTFNQTEPFLHRLVPTVVEQMAEQFPELQKAQQHVIDLIHEEEEAFAKTLDRGIELFEQAARRAILRVLLGTDIEEPFDYTPALANHLGKVFESIPGAEFMGGPIQGGLHHRVDQFAVTITVQTPAGERKTIRLPGEPSDQREALETTGLNVQISAEDAFKLHDTYGFPLDLTQLMAEERGMTVDVAGFNQLMEQARQRSRATGEDEADVADQLLEIVQKHDPPATEFLGYDHTEWTGTVTPRLFDLGGRTALVTEKTCFYAEQGGQVGDVGKIAANGATFTVTDTQKVGDVFFHLGTLDGDLPDGEPMEMTFAVDADRRQKITIHHTSTHILNHKLRKILGEHVQQKGSLVDDSRTRFDFSHNAAISPEQMDEIESLVQQTIEADLPVHWDIVPQEEALQVNGLRAVFGEKYPPRVRVVSVGPAVEEVMADPDRADWPDYSIEFCGGTHLSHTAEAERFALVSEEAVAKGVRRLTAVAGPAAAEANRNADLLREQLQAFQEASGDALQTGINDLSQQVNEQTLPWSARRELRAGLEELQKRAKAEQKQVEQQSANQAVESARAVAEAADDDLVVATIEGADGKTLLAAMDVVRKKKPEAAILLAAVNDGKIAFAASVPEARIKQGLKAGDWVREVAKVAGGGGGGKPDRAQAGGKNLEKLPEALEVAREFAAKQCN